MIDGAVGLVEVALNWRRCGWGQAFRSAPSRSSADLVQISRTGTAALMTNGGPMLTVI
jgi:hypothetical protein